MRAVQLGGFFTNYESYINTDHIVLQAMRCANRGRCKFIVLFVC